MARRRKLEGVATRTATDGTVRYRGTVYIHGEQVKGPWTTSEVAAIAWRDEMQEDARRGTTIRERVTVGVAIERFIAGIESGAIRNKSGQRYKPSVIVAYRTDLREIKKIIGRVFGEDTHLYLIRLPQASDVLDELRGMGRSDSWVRNKMAAFRAMCRWARQKGLMAVNPVDGLTMPITDETKRERIASVAEVRLLLAALDFPYRTMVALAAYGGMRFSEILGLEWRHIDLSRRSIKVEHAVDAGSGSLVRPKSRAAGRDIPICDPLMVTLEDHRLSCNSTGPLFPAIPGHQQAHAVKRAASAGRMNQSAATKKIKQRFEAAGLEPLGMHEARHTYASILIDAGATPKAISTYMGHSSIQITYDRYGHLMPGHEAEVLERMNSYLSPDAAEMSAPADAATALFEKGLELGLRLTVEEAAEMLSAAMAVTG